METIQFKAFKQLIAEWSNCFISNDKFIELAPGKFKQQAIEMVHKYNLALYDF